MSRASRLTLILCLASTASLAQIAAEDTPVVPLEADCPIGIRATVEKKGSLLAAQRLQVTLTQWPVFGIIASRIIVHGVASVANRPEPSEIVQNLDLNRILDPRLIGSPGSLPGWEPHPTGDHQDRVTATGYLSKRFCEEDKYPVAGSPPGRNGHTDRYF
jgi:hypothetical protein